MKPIRLFHKLILTVFVEAFILSLFALSTFACGGCAAGHQPETLAEKIQRRDGTNFLGVYMGMIAEWDVQTSRYSHPQGVMMFSSASGELLKWISYDDFMDIFVLKTKPEYK